MKNVLVVVLAVIGAMFTASDAQAQLFRRGGCVNGQCSTRSTQMVVPSVSYQSVAYEPMTYSQPAATVASDGYWVKQCNNGVCSMVWVPGTSAATTATVASVSSQTNVDTVVRERPILGGTVVKNVITKSDPVVTTSSVTAVPAPTVVSTVDVPTLAPVMATVTTTSSGTSVGVLLNL